MSLDTYRKKRDLDEIADGAATSTRKRRKTGSKTAAKDESSAETTGRARRATATARTPTLAKLPEVFRPQLAALTDRPPDSDLWWHETKYDGYRIAIRIDRGEVELLSRGMQSWTAKLPHLVEAARALPVRTALLDGELAAVESGGATSFQSLQSAFKEHRADRLVYFAFDLLHLDGRDLMIEPLAARKEAMARIIAAGRSGRGTIRYADHVAGHGPECFTDACERGLEGIICKRSDAPYRPGRGGSWLKVKCLKTQEFVVGGYTEPTGARKSFGALLLGCYAGKKLVYAGRVGTGFSDRTLGELGRRLRRLGRPRPPFASLPASLGRSRVSHWVEPTLVAQVEFRDWTRDGKLRQPSFQGLREDKDPRDVAREEPVKAPGGSQRRLKSPRSAAVDPASLGVRFTNPKKVLYQEQGITKSDLAAYYAEVADWILPHMAGRPLMLVRCPDGIHRECFFQKHAAKGSFEHPRLVAVRESGKTVKHLVADDLAGLLSLVQMGTLEIHVWGSRADDLERPDRMIFDLDPDVSVSWSRVVQSAVQLKALFDDLGLASFIKTTGGKGLHIAVPMARRQEWPEVSDFCRTLAEAVVRADPQRYTSSMSKTARRGKIFFDYLRNARGATSVAPYSTRARAGAPVSVPVRWEELDALSGPDQFNIENVPRRLRALKRDPWEGIADVRQTITVAVRRRLERA